MALQISNRGARALWLHAQGLSAAPTGALDIAGLIGGLGLLQLDSIRVVSRAHHHILWSRNQNYREPMLYEVMQRERTLFEHFTHDASLLPMEMYPAWQRQFRRMEDRIKRATWYGKIPGEADRAAIVARIATEGPLSSRAFDTKIEGKREMWSRPPHKRALDFMWYRGELATSHRESFTKFYDLAARVIPEVYRGGDVSDAGALEWLCGAALDRLVFAGERDIKAFWEAADLEEVKTWAAARPLVPVSIGCADGTHAAMLAPPDIEARLASVPAPTSRLRLLNPFDPVVRDRKRLLRLFGFDYRIEIFVPEAKRQYGYYVYPMLEGDRFVGRMEVTADRKRGTLTAGRIWPEAGVKWTAARNAKLDAELARMARFIGVETVLRG